MYCKYCGCEIRDRAKVCYHCGKPTARGEKRKTASVNDTAIAGFVITLVVLILGLVFDIIIHKNVSTILATVLLYAAIILAAGLGLVCAFIGYRKADKVEFEKLACAGIVLSVIAIIMTIIFLIVDIIEYNTWGFVPVHS